MPEIGPSNREVQSVSQITRSARQMLEGEFPIVFVEGEVSNFTRPSSGHWYLTLKDDNAQLRCAMFVNRNRFIRFTPKNGLQVMVRGKLSLYEGRGEFQMIVEYMEEAGDGALRRAFDTLRAKLESEGLFSAEKKPVPTIPAHICVITSSTGAAIRDVLHVLSRRFPAIPVSVVPVQVQGEESIRQVVKAIDFANRYDAEPFDVILLTRGGGSLEDLWTFNAEQVARAIFASRLPVVSAIGHETDFTIADFIADLRAPTPSAAAEMLSPNADDWRDTFARIERHLEQRVTSQLQQHKTHLNHVSRRLRHPGSRLTDLHQRLDELELRLQRAARHKIERSESKVRVLTHRVRNPLAQVQRESTRVTHALSRLQSAMRTSLKNQHHRLESATGKMNAYSPTAVLDRGYAIVMNGDTVLRSANDVEPGDTIVARLQHGQVHAEVTGKEVPDND